MTGWLLLIAAIIFEVFGTVAMKLSDGFTKLFPTISLFVFYTISLGLLTLTLKYIEVGTAYAVWSGLGTFLIAVAGILIFNEIVNVPKVIGLISIIFGVVMLHIGTHN